MSNIKKRLKDAYDSVIFYANKTWTNDNYLYQKANQDLYARYVRIQETFAEEVTRPRTVRDSIPQSKLAQYSNYKYDESREMSYTPSGPDVTFHYPCQFRQVNVNEPWMLPEVEQLFIWLTYSPKFNLTQYMDLADFSHVESFERTRGFCTAEDFHTINPRTYESFERTPGKSRFTKYECLVELDPKMVVPPMLNFNSFEDMTVKMKFDVDTIKNIWKTNRSEDIGPKKNLQVYKSSFDNLFIDESSSSSQKFLQYPEYFNIDRNPYHFNELQEKANDFRNLQNLTDVLKKMKENDVNNGTNRNQVNQVVVPVQLETDCAAKTPTRRLYSDVVQGVASNKHSNSKTHLNVDNSPPLIHSSSCRDIQFGMSNIQDDPVLCHTSQTYKYVSPKTRPPSPSTSWLDQLRNKQDSRVFLKPDDKKVAECSQTKACSSSHTQTQTKSFPTPSLFTETISSSPISCYNSFSSYQSCVPTNFITNEYQPSEVQATYSAFHNPNVQNVYPGNYYTNSPYQYPQGNLYCNSFSTANYPTNQYSYPTTSYSTQLSTNAAATRNFVQQQQPQQQKPNAVHYNSGQWIINQFRTPSVFNVAHFPPQPYFLLPPHFPKQRWVHYMRSPSTPQQYQINATTPPHTPPPQQQVQPQQVPQSWNNNVQQQNQQVYKTTSTQHIGAQNYTFEGSSSMHSLDAANKQKLKSRKINSQVNLAFKKIRSKSPESVYSGEREYSYGTKFKSNSTTSKRSSISSDLSCPMNVNVAKALAAAAAVASPSSSSSQQQKVATPGTSGTIVSSLPEVSPAIVESSPLQHTITGTINKKELASKDSTKLFSHSNSSSSMMREYECELRSLPVTATTSEELERQALDEYESSNESFYKELERQAEEQYEDSENWLGPPNESEVEPTSSFGGHDTRSSFREAPHLSPSPSLSGRCRDSDWRCRCHDSLAKDLNVYYIYQYA